MIFSHVLYRLSYLGTSRYSRTPTRQIGIFRTILFNVSQTTVVILVTIGIELVLAGAASFLALQLARRTAGPSVVSGLYLVAIMFALVAIASITLIAKAEGA
jgi:hypothetical protein